MTFETFQTWLSTNSQNVINSIRATLAALVLFELIQITAEQLAGLTAALEVIFATVTAKTTVAHTKIDTIVESKVSDILSTPGEVKARINDQP